MNEINFVTFEAGKDYVNDPNNPAEISSEEMQTLISVARRIGEMRITFSRPLKIGDFPPVTGAIKAETCDDTTLITKENAKKAV
jgi:hypothetical protein